MRVLITINRRINNTIINRYYEGISPHAEVLCSSLAFWDSNINFDIIHIHWPETLIHFYQYDANLLTLFDKRLSYWKENNAKIVLTYHNEKPHNQRELDSDIYNLINKYVDGFIHLGNYSYSTYINSTIFGSKKNVLIYHPDYFNIENKVSKSEARKHLGLDKNLHLFLSFGIIRTQEEENFLIKAFKQLKLEKKTLIIPNSYTLKNKTGYSKPLMKIKYYIRKYLLKRKHIIIDENYIADNFIQYYMNAADIVISPRLNTLNSGVVIMGFSFSKIVIGPSIGNIKELLELNGNPTFNPNDASSLTKAMEQAIHNHSNIGLKNKEFIELQCNFKKIGLQHIEFYKKVIDAN